MIGFLIGNKIGRMALLVLAIAAVALILVRYGASKEKQRAAVKALKGALRAVEDRRKVEDEIRGKSTDDINDALSRWVRDA